MNISDILVGFCSRECIEQFHEARFVRITHGGLAIWLDPFGMLDPQVVVYLLPKLGVGVDLVSHCHWLGERFKYALERFLQSLGGIVDQRWHRGRAPKANLGTPKGRTHLLTVCSTLGQLDRFAALALQQHGQQSTLREGCS
jgi:hypothetical protein